jgi:uncharacterized protein (DUF58 family)
MEKHIRFQIEPMAKWFPLIILGILLLQILTESQVWIAIFVALGGAWICATIWAVLLARNIHLVREIQSSQAQVGDQFFERITIHNSGWAPATYLHFRDESTIADYDPSRIIHIERKSLRSWLVRHVCRHRGQFTYGPTTLTTGDPFGFYRVSIHFPASTSLLVVPPTIDLPLIDIAAGEWVGEGRKAASVFEPTVATSGVREYRPGDRLSAIHWPTSARKNVLYSRTFDSSPSSAWWIFVDLNQFHQHELEGMSTEEHIVILAASIVQRGLKLHQPVGLLCSNTPGIQPKLGDLQRTLLLTRLALVRSNTESLGELLIRARSDINRKTSVVIITADGTEAWVGNVIRLQNRKVIPTVLMLDPTPYGGYPSMENVVKHLQDHRIRHFLIPPELIRPPSRELPTQNRIESVYRLHHHPGSTIPLRGLEWIQLGQ